MIDLKEAPIYIYSYFRADFFDETATLRVSIPVFADPE
jgi:hypothetical protein